MPTTLNHAEFGVITIRRSHLAHSLRLKIDHRGTIIVSMPKRAPLYLAKRLLDEAREQVRRTIQKTPTTTLQHGDVIGKSHRLVIRRGEEIDGRVIGTFVEVTLPQDMPIEAPQAQTHIKQIAIKALRTQAKAFLTRQLQMLAQQHGFYYESIRFSNAGTRWGSCSSTGTISLNIWLMQLPFELIDYVLVHELCHTKHMNHSPAFWGLVETITPDYRLLRRALKAERPYL